ncbi:hypothetical protein HDU87_001681, partial [Geranomyces variabilis]
ILHVNLRYRVVDPLLLTRNYEDPFQALSNPAQTAVNSVVSRLSYQQFMRAKKMGGDVPDTDVTTWVEAFKTECLQELMHQATTYGIVVESFDVLDRSLEGDLGKDLEKQAEQVLQNQIKATQLELSNHIAIETQKGQLAITRVKNEQVKSEADAGYYSATKKADAVYYAALQDAKAAAESSELEATQKAKNIVLLAQARQREIEVLASAYEGITNEHVKTLQLQEVESGSFVSALLLLVASMVAFRCLKRAPWISLFSSSSAVLLMLSTAVAAQQRVAPQQPVSDRADTAIPDNGICEGNIQGTPELLDDPQLSNYPFAADFDPAAFNWTTDQFNDFSLHGTAPPGQQSAWTATQPWSFPQYPEPGAQNPLPGQTEVDPTAVARCSEGGSGPDYASYTLLHGGNQTVATALFQLSQDIDVGALRKDIDSGNMRALGTALPMNDFNYDIFFRFTNAKNETLDANIQMSGSDAEAQQVPPGTTTVHFGIIVNMADIDPDLLDEVCFQDFSVTIGRFTGSAGFINNGADTALTVEVVGLLLCFINVVVLTFILTFRRQNFMHQITPLNLVIPRDTKHSSILALMFVCMLSYATQILENYKAIIKLNGFAQIAYPFILIPALILLAIFHLPDFVAFSQVKRYRRRLAAAAGVWTSMCRVLLQLAFLVQTIASYYTGSFIGSRTLDNSDKFFAIAQNLPQLFCQFGVLIWFAHQWFALKDQADAIDQTAEHVYLHKASYEKDYKYTRDLFSRSELQKRTDEVRGDRNGRIPKKGLFAKRDPSTADDKPRVTFKQKLANMMDRIFFHPYRKLDVRFRILYLVSIYIVWVTTVKYVRYVNTEKTRYGCQTARWLVFLEAITAKGRFSPFQSDNPAFLATVTSDYFNFAITLARLLEAASALAVAFTLLSVLFNITATAKHMRRQMRLYARGQYPEHFSKLRSYSANVASLSTITGKLVGYSLMGAGVFFFLLFAFLLLIFWAIAFFSFSPTLRIWLRDSTKLWIFLATIAVNTLWSRIQTFVVLKAFTVDGLRFKYKTGFFLWEFIVMFANATASLNAFIFRLVLAAFSTTFYMGRMDVQLVHGLLGRFSGWSTYQAYVYANYVYSNSVSNTFIGLLLETHFERRLARQRQFSTGHDVEAISIHDSPYGKKSENITQVAAVRTRAPPLSRTAKKFWLALYLHRNPTLRFYRKHYVVQVLAENPQETKRQ